LEEDLVGILSLELKMPPLTVGESIVWQKAMPAREVASVEISSALYWLTYRFGWLLVLAIAAIGFALSEAEPTLAMIGLTASSALLIAAFLLIGTVVIHDFCFSGEELYVVTNKRLISIDKKSAKHLSLNSSGIKLWKIPAFGDAGLLLFMDFQQEGGVVEFAYKDGGAELASCLPAKFGWLIRDLDTRGPEI
jgi:hypothetical protein